MAKSENQKRKLLYLADLLRRETDETHGLTVQQMIDELARRDVRAERKKHLRRSSDADRLRHGHCEAAQRPHPAAMRWCTGTLNCRN